MSLEPPDIRYITYPVAIVIWGLSLAGRIRVTPGKAFEAFIITHGFWLAWWGLYKLRQLRLILELKAQVQNLQDRLDAAEKLREQTDQNAEDGDDEQEPTDEYEEDTDEEIYTRPLGPMINGREGYVCWHHRSWIRSICDRNPFGDGVFLLIFVAGSITNE
ncbi:hypothetical protein K505DRAFT_86812 [Melanomma pulvis-pyrius CBS 109.77]|uniref:Uncharacterized protein n=1 Tax=Melanomma pulvis-pyrius CBS 109.77 TaxID=1314802 RepID=A0A6A6X1A4_9PLEO|nr:hypothetical protein K505DRAFT_86812 [Melanomma pulvis-pyrius CBS 109.77]